MPLKKGDGRLISDNVYYGGVSRDPRWRKGTRLMFNMVDGLRMGRFVHVHFLP
jgi:hypothetical protein